MGLESITTYIDGHQSIFIPVGIGVGVFCLANLYYGQTRFAGPSGFCCGEDPPCCDSCLLPCLRCECCGNKDRGRFFVDEHDRDSSNDYSPI